MIYIRKIKERKKREKKEKKKRKKERKKHLMVDNRIFIFARQLLLSREEVLALSQYLNVEFALYFSHQLLVCIPSEGGEAREGRKETVDCYFWRERREL